MTRMPDGRCRPGRFGVWQTGRFGRRKLTDADRGERAAAGRRGYADPLYGGAFRACGHASARI
ncbi:hypothetical protein [Paenibacillus humicola]|uniref:hypothetical protein n=1 Tax=Paenibacillus humicola TaxID=3110540 RepID=UPI00237ADEDC|nr:hypothetical protein [Paenibacillus humicola]